MRPKLLNDGLGVGERDLIIFDQPIERDGIIWFESQSAGQFGAQFPNGTGQTGSQRHFGRVPAGDCRQVSVGPLYVGLLHSGFDQPQDTPAKDEQVARLHSLEEGFLDRTETPAIQNHVDEPFGNNGANINEKFAGNARVCERDYSVMIDQNFSEDAGVLLSERISAPLQILEDAFELIVGQIAKGQRPSH